MVEDERRQQRLYLSRGTSEIYIDTVPLPTHQIEGIRFLYQHYVLRKPGVILNDPSGYGKRIQTVLFINAIRLQLKLPILILCAEGKEVLWAHLFEEWTNMGTEVTIQKGTAFPLKPVCHISAHVHMYVMERREWSILVVEGHHHAYKVLDSKIKAEYKIWLASHSMKKRLPSFALVYMWMYPKAKIDIDSFSLFRATPTTVLTKSAMLDALMEDIVLRRKRISVSWEKEEETVTTEVKSRKNKDATGKKIKRSKITGKITDNEINNKSLHESDDIFSSDMLNDKSEIQVIQHDNSVVENDDADFKNNDINSDVVDIPSGAVENDANIIDKNHDKNEVDTNSVSENNKTDCKLEGFELKLKQMEELAMNKFKGSFLDSMI